MSSVEELLSFLSSAEEALKNANDRIGYAMEGVKACRKRLHGTSDEVYVASPHPAPSESGEGSVLSRRSDRTRPLQSVVVSEAGPHASFFAVLPAEEAAKDKSLVPL